MISSSFLYGSPAFSSQNLCPPAINLDSFAIKSATFFSSITQFGAHILGIGRRSHQHKSHLQYFMACRQFFSTRVGANPARSQNPLQAKWAHLWRLGRDRMITMEIPTLRCTDASNRKSAAKAAKLYQFNTNFPYGGTWSLQIYTKAGTWRRSFCRTKIFKIARLSILKRIWTSCPEDQNTMTQDCLIVM